MAIKLNIKKTTRKTVNFEIETLNNLENYFKYLCKENKYGSVKLEEHFDDLVNKIINSRIDKDKKFKAYLKEEKKKLEENTIADNNEVNNS